MMMRRACGETILTERGLEVNAMVRITQMRSDTYHYAWLMGLMRQKLGRDSVFCWWMTRNELLHLLGPSFTVVFMSDGVFVAFRCRDISHMLQSWVWKGFVMMLLHTIEHLPCWSDAEVVGYMFILELTHESRQSFDSLNKPLLTGLIILLSSAGILPPWETNRQWRNHPSPIICPSIKNPVHLFDNDGDKRWTICGKYLSVFVLLVINMGHVELVDDVSVHPPGRQTNQLDRFDLPPVCPSTRTSNKPTWSVWFTSRLSIHKDVKSIEFFVSSDLAEFFVCCFKWLHDYSFYYLCGCTNSGWIDEILMWWLIILFTFFARIRIDRLKKSSNKRGSTNNGETK